MCDSAAAAQDGRRDFINTLQLAITASINRMACGRVRAHSRDSLKLQRNRESVP